MRAPWFVLVVSTIIEALILWRPRVSSLVVDVALQTALLVVPMTLVRLREHGLRPGVRWPHWFWPMLAVTVPAAVLATRLPSINGAYPMLSQARAQPWLLVPSTLLFATYGLAWEFFFRGFLLFGLRPRLGAWAILVQAIPCALMHMGKPNLEFAASFPAALVFGVMAWRTGSIVPGWALHISLALAVNLGCVLWPM